MPTMNNAGMAIMTDELMELAKNKYQTLIDTGAWLQQTEDQRQIVAMAAPRFSHWKREN
jgi:hypothetical protein